MRSRFGNPAAGDVVGVGRQGQSRQNADDRDSDHQLDQAEAVESVVWTGIRHRLHQMRSIGGGQGQYRIRGRSACLVIALMQKRPVLW